jgi:hypothetical protein
MAPLHPFFPFFGGLFSGGGGGDGVFFGTKPPKEGDEKRKRKGAEDEQGRVNSPFLCSNLSGSLHWSDSGKKCYHKWKKALGLIDFAVVPHSQTTMFQRGPLGCYISCFPAQNIVAGRHERKGSRKVFRVTCNPQPY